MARAPRCAVCKAPVAPRGANRFFPLCSERCRLIDLGRWLGEDYRVPAGPPGDGSAGDPQDPGGASER
jgi:endogenous inhibitor of DNA gyrase (YacG/DUF329 family)